MKKIIVKSLKGDLLDKYQAEDPMPWLMENIKSNKWGLPERVKKISDCTRFELANVLKINPPDEVTLGADYRFEIIDVQSETIEKEKMRQKRKDLVRDWEALPHQRKERLIKRIMCHVLENMEVEVVDV
jgi:hypothetical protein